MLLLTSWSNFRIMRQGVETIIMANGSVHSCFGMSFARQEQLPPEHALSQSYTQRYKTDKNGTSIIYDKMILVQIRQ